MKTPRQKITAMQSHHIVQVYLHLGTLAAAELAVEYGVSRSYGPSLANQLGLYRPRKFSGGSSISKTVNHNDPRWARAIAVGAVVA